MQVNTSPILHTKLRKLEILFLGVLYVVSFSLMLFNNGVFWDDWILYTADKASVANTFRQAGSPFTSYYHNFLLSYGHDVFLYRIIVFFAYLISGIFVYKVLSRIKEVTSEAIFFIVAIFMVLPVNSARIAIIDSMYAIYYFSFFMAFWLLSVAVSRNSRILYFFSLLFFLFSFNALSFLVYFFATAIPYIFYLQFGFSKQNLYSNIKQYFVENWYLLALPFVFFVFKSYFWRPFGNYDGYNTIDVEKIFLATSHLIYDKYFFVLLLATTFLLAVYVYIKNRNLQKDILFCALGIVLFFAGIFPYLAVGKFPTFEDWNSRHQLLMPLGVAFLIFYFVNILSSAFAKNRQKLKQIALVFILGFFTYKNISYYIDFQRDYYAQMSLMKNFRSNPIFREGHTFIFYDAAKPWANGRTLRFYEFSAMFHYIFGDQTRIGLLSQNQDQLLTYVTKYRTPENSLKDFDIGNIKSTKVDILPGDAFELFDSDTFIIKMLLYHYVRPELESQYIEKYIIIREKIGT